jgi:hypothetical protein
LHLAWHSEPLLPLLLLLLLVMMMMILSKPLPGPLPAAAELPGRGESPRVVLREG